MITDVSVVVMVVVAVIVIVAVVMVVVLIMGVEPAHSVFSPQFQRCHEQLLTSRDVDLR